MGKHAIISSATAGYKPPNFCATPHCYALFLLSSTAENSEENNRKNNEHAIINTAISWAFPHVTGNGRKLSPVSIVHYYES